MATSYNIGEWKMMNPADWIDIKYDIPAYGMWKVEWTHQPPPEILRLSQPLYHRSLDVDGDRRFIALLIWSWKKSQENKYDCCYNITDAVLEIFGHKKYVAVTMRKAEGSNGPAK